MQAELEAIIDQIAAEDPDFSAIVELGLNRGPFEVPETEPIVVTLDRSATKLLGRQPTWPRSK